MSQKLGLSWLIGGAQGSGVDSSANIFARACAFGGLHVFGKREYYSNIKGEHSYFHVRVSDRVIRSNLDSVHVLATFDNETIIRHWRSVVEGGAVIYDPSQTGQKIGDIPTLEPNLLQEILRYLKGEGLGETVQDALADAKKRGARLYPVPYMELLTGDVAKAYPGSGMSTLSRMVNVMAVASSLGILRYDREPMYQAIKTTFKSKAKVAEMNVKGAEIAYDYSAKTFTDGFEHSISMLKTDEPRIFIAGTVAVALGKMLGGCRFQTYYPITPATDESVYLEDHEKIALKTSETIENPQIEEASFIQGNGGSGILVVQTEDEVAAITMATGASLSGARAATSTSGPGFSLMAEGLGWAGMNEVPVVVTLYQRAGPSTGLPTRHEQGDLRFTLHAGHGEFPRIVLASGDMEECFYDTIKAFNFAERYQLPVIHILDKSLANSNMTMRLPDLENITTERGNVLSAEDLRNQLANSEKYQRFRHTDTGISPRIYLGTSGATFWNTGDEHDELGHITEDPANRMKMMEKRMRKLEVADNEIPNNEKINFFGNESAPITILSWGSTKGAILDAMDILANDGIETNFIQTRLISPFPNSYISELLSETKKRISVEMNFSSQFAGLVREHTGVAMDHHIVKYTGRPITCEELYHAIKKVLIEGDRRVVLTHGA